MADDDKSKDELVEEVKKLRQGVEADNKRKKQDSASNALMIIGAVLIVISLLAWCSIRGL